MPPSLSVFEANSGSINGLQFEARSGDPSAVTRASITASLKNLSKELSLLPPPSRNDEGVKPELPAVPSACEVSDNRAADAEMKDTVDQNDGADVVSSDKDVAPFSDTAHENFSLDSPGLDISADADGGKFPGVTNEFLRMFAGSSAPEFDLGGSLSKILDEQRELREGLKDADSPISLSKSRQQYKAGLQQRVSLPDNIEVSFESFPYYLRCKLICEC